MIIFAACASHYCKTFEPIRTRLVDTGKLNELQSYFLIDTFTGHSIERYGKSFFLDSGAFSAWNLKKPLDIKNYAEFLNKYKDQIDYYANLDAIPVKQDAEASKTAAKKTFENQKFLEDQGLNPLPVFHKGEPWHYLEYYIENYDYICLGGLVADRKQGGLRDFFDHVWEKYLTNDDGTPKVKVHAFGMTSLPLMLRYPWFSADSQAWLISAKLGYVWIPVLEGSGYRYDRRPLSVGISNETGSKAWHGWHYTTFDKERKKEVNKYFELKNLNVEDLTKVIKWRTLCNLEFIMDLQDYAPWPKTFQPKQLNLL